MKVYPINPVSFNLLKQNSLQTSAIQANASTVSEYSQSKPVYAKVALSQMGNVSFGDYERDDFSAYDNYEGPQPPQIELEKYYLSRKVQENIDKQNYLAAINGKIDLARICRRQGKERDAYMLENSIRDLYKEMPMYQRDEAKLIISGYNFDMAKYIDQDISKY